MSSSNNSLFHPSVSKTEGLSQRAFPYKTILIPCASAFRTTKVSAVPVAPTASKANLGLSKQRAFVTPATHLDKGDVFIKKYDGNDEEFRKITLVLQENINLPNDEKAVKKLRDPKKLLPWDVVVIMTTKWLLIASLQPQKTKEAAKIHATHIWAKVKNLLEDDKHPREFNTIICWFLAADDSEVANLKLHADVYHIQVEERMQAYFRIFVNGANEIGRDDKLVLEEVRYFLGKGPGPGDQTVYHRSQIVIHDHSTFLGVAEYEKLKAKIHYDSYKKNQAERATFSNDFIDGPGFL